MIKSIKVINYLDNGIDINLYAPEETGLIVKEISGLGPAKANINTTDIAFSDGAAYNSARLSTRNIVLNFVFLPNMTIEDTRLLTYEYFPIKHKVTLVFETENRLAEISGYVESNEPDIFSSSEGCQISIVCPDPYFYSYGDEKLTEFNGTNPLFEFPFSNESATEKVIEMGKILRRTAMKVLYEGDAETGITISIHAIGEVKNLLIYNTETKGTFKINTDRLKEMTGSVIKDGDDITIVTYKGRKSVTLLRDGVSTNILNCIDTNTEWFQLKHGDNYFAYEADVGESNLIFRMSNRLIYEGV